MAAKGSGRSNPKRQGKSGNDVPILRRTPVNQANRRRAAVVKNSGRGTYNPGTTPPIVVPQPGQTKKSPLTPTVYTPPTNANDAYFAGPQPKRKKRMY